jgi:hypothetical protein
MSASRRSGRSQVCRARAARRWRDLIALAGAAVEHGSKYVDVTGVEVLVLTKRIGC